MTSDSQIRDFSFKLFATDGPARAGEISTAHGTIQTPDVEANS